MADAADRHLRHAESKVGTSVSVPADYFHENYTHNERYFESVMEVLDNGLVRVKWEIDATQSLVSLNDILIEDASKMIQLPLILMNNRKNAETEKNNIHLVKKLFDSK